LQTSRDFRPLCDRVIAPALPLTPALGKRLSGQPFLLLLDVDGTLSPIAPRPDEAVVAPETRRIVSELAALPHVYVAVISGRGAHDAARLVGVDGLWTIGNHGFEVVAPGGVVEPRTDVEPFLERLKAAQERISDAVIRYAGAIVEDKHWTFSVHYRLVDRAVVPQLLEKVLETSREFGLRATRGKQVVEVRPPIDTDKGTAAVALAQRLGVLGGDASILCAGDDSTDEDAFAALRRENARFVTIRVGGEDDPTAVETAAEFSVADTEELRELLEQVRRLRASKSSS
jgi:trehalose-phosphatase